MSHVSATSDLHFPAVHVRPFRGWVGDPNGPVWHRGRYHLYFQHNPSVPPRARDMVWGHCSSQDLVSWEMHGVALGPSPEHPGTEEFWSGNTAEYQGHLYAFYSAQRDSDRYQPPRMTVSDDGGFSFHGDWPTALLPSNGGTTPEIFRDPFAWHENGRWSMLVGSGSGDGTEPQVRRYESTDLRSWQDRGVFASAKGIPGAPGDLGSAWECPQYAWELGVLFVGAWRSEGAPMVVYALSGGEDFGASTLERADHGTELYAPSVMRDSEGRYLLWGWVREARSTAWQDEAGWAGMLSLPREVRLENGHVVFTPPTELRGLRARLCFQGLLSTELVVPQVPRAFELALPPSEGRTTIRLETGHDEVFEIIVDGPTRQVVIDRRVASADPRACRGTTTIETASRPRGQARELRWFVDHSVSELFLPGGMVVTTRLYPVSPEPWRVRVTQTGEAGGQVRVWALRRRMSRAPWNLARSSALSMA